MSDFDSGTLTLTNSTVSGNSADDFRRSIGGGLFNSGALTLSNSTVSGNSGDHGGGVFTSGTLTLTRTLISGNYGYDDGPSEVEGGTIIANNHNLFGHDGDAGVVGFSPGLSDLVPSEGLGAILNTTLASNGGLDSYPCPSHRQPGH